MSVIPRKNPEKQQANKDREFSLGVVSFCPFWDKQNKGYKNHFNNIYICLKCIYIENHNILYNQIGREVGFNTISINRSGVIFLKYNVHK